MCSILMVTIVFAVQSLDMLDIGSMQLEGSSGMQWKNSMEKMHNGSNVQQNSGNRAETPKYEDYKFFAELLVIINST